MDHQVVERLAIPQEQPVAVGVGQNKHISGADIVVPPLDVIHAAAVGDAGNLQLVMGMRLHPLRPRQIVVLDADEHTVLCVLNGIVIEHADGTAAVLQSEGRIQKLNLQLLIRTDAWLLSAAAIHRLSLFSPFLFQSTVFHPSCQTVWRRNSFFPNGEPLF